MRSAPSLPEVLRHTRKHVACWPGPNRSRSQTKLRFRANECHTNTSSCLPQSYSGAANVTVAFQSRRASRQSKKDALQTRSTTLTLRKCFCMRRDRRRQSNVDLCEVAQMALVSPVPTSCLPPAPAPFSQVDKRRFKSAFVCLQN